MDKDRLLRQALGALQLEQDTAKWKAGRPSRNWNNTIHQDLKVIGMSWEEAEHTAVNRVVCGPVCFQHWMN